MSVRAHLRIDPAAYDRRIRTLIPRYDELLKEASSALRAARRPISTILDLGIGTGALTAACLRYAPRARVIGIDADDSMAAVARTRLRRVGRRLTLSHASFLDVPLPPCDAIVASYSLHHIKNRRAKQAFYRRCFGALRPGGVLVSGDCMPSSAPGLCELDLEQWYTHLDQTFGRGKGRPVYESWADEDTYLPLADEVAMLERAGFTVDVPWRRSPFAVVAAVKG